MARKIKKQSRKLLAFFLTATVLGTFFAYTKNSRAASLTALSDTMSNLNDTEASDHTIRFTTPTGAGDITDTIIITFPSGFGETGVDYTDIDLSHGASTGYETEETLAAAASATEWGAVFSGDVLTLTHPNNASNGDITATDKVVVEIGNNAASGSAQMTNPSTGTAVIAITGAFGDSGNIAVSIVDDDQIPVTATVNPTITFTVTNTALALGVLDSGAGISASGYNNLTIGTNGTGGYTITVKDAGNGSNPGLNNSAASHLIASSTATLSAGAEGYGGNCNKVSGDGTCTFVDGATENVTGFTLAGGTFASYGSKPSSTDTFQIRVKAEISSSTDAGAYADTLTLIATGNF